MEPADLAGLPVPRIVHTSGVMAAISPTCRALLQDLVSGALAPARVSFDVNYRSALWASAAEARTVLLDLARRADIVFVGRDEAEVLWGTTTAAQIRDLLPDVHTLIVKDGAVEAVEFSGDAMVRIPAPGERRGTRRRRGCLRGRLVIRAARRQDARHRLRAAHDAATVVL